MRNWPGDPEIVLRFACTNAPLNAEPLADMVSVLPALSGIAPIVASCFTGRRKSPSVTVRVAGVAPDDRRGDDEIERAGDFSRRQRRDRDRSVGTGHRADPAGGCHGQYHRSTRNLRADAERIGAWPANVGQRHA